jgi:tRNA threonylcarbamoyladenosine biosynthesis protein TsaE
MPEPPLNSFRFTAESEADTERLGAMLAAALAPGMVVALNGNLGAGKTRLVQGVAAALGVDRREVTSPTFVLIQEYEGRLPIYHVDAYRLRDSDQFLELGADELMASPAVCFIEWAERVADVLPADLLTIDVEIDGPERRTFHTSGSGAKSTGVVEGLLSQCAPGDQAVKE